MTNKLSSILAKSIGVRPVAKYGQTEPKLTNTSVEGIWSVEYCRQHPEKAAQAIKTLQVALDDVELELCQILEITGQ